MSMPRMQHVAGRTYLVSQHCAIAGAGFYDEACFEFYLLRLLNCLNVFQVKLHSYCLLNRQISLLLTPGTYSGISSLLRFLNHTYSDYFNKRFRRGRNVWREEFTSCQINGEKFILDAQKYVERLPLDGKQAAHAGVYRWSSYCHNSFGGNVQPISLHPALRNFLAGSAPNRFGSYREFIAEDFEPPYERYLHFRLSSGPKLGRRLQVQPPSAANQIIA